MGATVNPSEKMSRRAGWVERKDLYGSPFNPPGPADRVRKMTSVAEMLATGWLPRARAPRLVHPPTHCASLYIDSKCRKSAPYLVCAPTKIRGNGGLYRMSIPLNMTSHLPLEAYRRYTEEEKAATGEAPDDSLMWRRLSGASWNSHTVHSYWRRAISGYVPFLGRIPREEKTDGYTHYLEVLGKPHPELDIFGDKNYPNDLEFIVWMIRTIPLPNTVSWPIITAIAFSAWWTINRRWLQYEGTPDGYTDDHPEFMVLINSRRDFQFLTAVDKQGKIQCHETDEEARQKCPCTVGKLSEIALKCCLADFVYYVLRRVWLLYDLDRPTSHIHPPKTKVTPMGLWVYSLMCKQWALSVETAKWTLMPVRDLKHRFAAEVKDDMAVPLDETRKHFRQRSAKIWTHKVSLSATKHSTSLVPGMRTFQDFGLPSFITHAYARPDRPIFSAVATGYDNEEDISAFVARVALFVGFGSSKAISIGARAYLKNRPRIKALKGPIPDEVEEEEGDEPGEGKEEKKEIPPTPTPPPVIDFLRDDDDVQPVVAAAVLVIDDWPLELPPEDDDTAAITDDLSMLDVGHPRKLEPLSMMIHEERPSCGQLSANALRYCYEEARGGRLVAKLPRIVSDGVSYDSYHTRAEDGPSSIRAGYITWCRRYGRDLFSHANDQKDEMGSYCRWPIRVHTVGSIYVPVPDNWGSDFIGLFGGALHVYTQRPATGERMPIHHQTFLRESVRAMDCSVIPSPLTVIHLYNALSCVLVMEQDVIATLASYMKRTDSDMQRVFESGAADYDRYITSDAVIEASSLTPEYTETAHRLYSLGKGNLQTSLQTWTPSDGYRLTTEPGAGLIGTTALQNLTPMTLSVGGRPFQIPSTDSLFKQVRDLRVETTGGLYHWDRYAAVIAAAERSWDATVADELSTAIRVEVDKIYTAVWAPLLYVITCATSPPAIQCRMPDSPEIASWYDACQEHSIVAVASSDIADRMEALLSATTGKGKMKESLHAVLQRHKVITPATANFLTYLLNFVPTDSIDGSATRLAIKEAIERARWGEAGRPAMSAIDMTVRVDLKEALCDPFDQSDPGTLTDAYNRLSVSPVVPVVSTRERLLTIIDSLHHEFYTMVDPAPYRRAQSIFKSWIPSITNSAIRRTVRAGPWCNADRLH